MMNKFTSALSLLVFGSSLALADSRFAELRSHAARVEKDNLELAKMLKAKQFDTAQVKDKLAATGQDLEKINALVADLEGHATSLSPAAQKDWQLLREKVQLLGIFHGVKKNLLEKDDPLKQRSLLRAHAEGVARRAALLQQTAGRLERN